MNLHGTFLLRIPVQSIERIERIIQTVASMHNDITITFGNFFLSKVERIRYKGIYCIGVELISPELSTMRTECAGQLCDETIPKDKVRGYPGAGHISLAYVTASWKGEAEKLVEMQNEMFGSPTFPLTEISVRENETGFQHVVSLKNPTNSQEELISVQSQDDIHR